MSDPLPPRLPHISLDEDDLPDGCASTFLTTIFVLLAFFVLAAVVCAGALFGFELMQRLLS